MRLHSEGAWRLEKNDLSNTILNNASSSFLHLLLTSSHTSLALRAFNQSRSDALMPHRNAGAGGRKTILSYVAARAGMVHRQSCKNESKPRPRLSQPQSDEVVNILRSQKHHQRPLTPFLRSHPTAAASLFRAK